MTALRAPLKARHHNPTRFAATLLHYPADSSCSILKAGGRKIRRRTPTAGFESPQSNDVDVDQRGLIYVLDRDQGLDILEYTGRR